MKKLLIPVVLLCLFVVFFACDRKKNTSNIDGEGSVNVENIGIDTEEDEAEPIIMEKDGLKLSSVDNSPEFPDALIYTENPGYESKFETGKIKFSYNIRNYELGNQTTDAEQKMCANSAKGQHIHLILNNGPYTAHYEDKFDMKLEPGHYVSLSFLSRSYHESIKHRGAYDIKRFSVGITDTTATDTSDFVMSDKHLFYSRPKGEYFGDDTKKILLDFYLYNTKLKENGDKIRATINGTEFTLTRWVAYFIEGLPTGENTIKLELIDKDDNFIEGPFNSVERTIMLSELK